MDGETVRYLRMKRGMTQGELAGLTGYTRSLISKLETGSTANHRTLSRILEALRKTGKPHRRTA